LPCWLVPVGQHGGHERRLVQHVPHLPCPVPRRKYPRVNFTPLVQTPSRFPGLSAELDLASMASSLIRSYQQCFLESSFSASYQLPSIIPLLPSSSQIIYFPPCPGKCQGSDSCWSWFRALGQVRNSFQWKERESNK